MCVHKILTPLASIKGLAELIAESGCKNPEEIVADTTNIIKATDDIVAIKLKTLIEK